MIPVFFQKALEIAARMVDPTAAAAFGIVFAGVAFWIAFKKKDKRVVLVLGIILGVGIIFLGALPLLAKTYLNTHGVYEIRVVVLGVTGSPVEDAMVVCTPSGEEKSIAGGSECDVPPKNRPADGVFTAYASVKSAFLLGKGQLQLGGDYNPQLTIQLQPDVSATVRGEVLGRQRRVVPGAWVSVVGYESERVQSGSGGGFVLPTHAAQGQMIRMHVEADGYGPYEGLQQAGDGSVSIQLER